MNEKPAFRLDGKVALITGAATGLGAAISVALARQGADIAGPRLNSTGVSKPWARVPKLRSRLPGGQLDLFVLHTLRMFCR